jgi:hypothetical protein
MVSSLQGLAPFQIGFVVRDVDRPAREFDARLGAGPWPGIRRSRASMGSE